MSNQLTSGPIKIQKGIVAAPLRASEKSVLYSLSTYLGSPKHRPDKWNIVWPSQETIQHASGVKSISQISRIVKKLEKEGYLAISKRDTKNGCRKSNIYTFNVPLFYKLADSLMSEKANGGFLNEQLPITNEANKDTNIKLQSLKEDIPVEESSNALISTLPIQHSQIYTETVKDKLKVENIEEIKKDEENYLIKFCGHDPKSNNFIKKNIKETQLKQVQVLRIVKNYYHEQPTSKAMTAFWWALVKEFHPKQYKLQKKLTFHQYKALKSLFSAWGKHAFHVLAVSISDWEVAKEYAFDSGAWKSEIPKCGPTPVFMSKYADGFWKYRNYNYLGGSDGDDENKNASAQLVTILGGESSAANCINAI